MTTKIRTRKRGPLVVEGDVEVYDKDGNKLEIPGTRILLCRCGASLISPRCDGSHHRIAFEVEREEGEREAVAGSIDEALAFAGGTTTHPEEEQR